MYHIYLPACWISSGKRFSKRKSLKRYGEQR
jgi:hypothetical protein